MRLSTLRFLRLVSFITLILTANMTIAQDTNEQQRIVFFGDSITQQGDQPGGYVDLVRKAVKDLPNQSIEVIGAGIGGNKVPNLLARLDKDVLSKNPTTVVIYIGINDVWHSTKGAGTPKNEFESGLIELVERIRAAGAKVLLCTPSVIGEKTDGTNELDPLLEEYATLSREVASKLNVAMLDLHGDFRLKLREINPENQSQGILTRDGVHLNAAGNKFVADRMLDGLNLAKLAIVTEAKLRHIVLFKFVDGLGADDVNEIVDAFAALPDQIDEISGFEMGTNISPENLEQGFTHCFVVSFDSVADRDAYLPHPSHTAFVKLIDGKIDKVLVFDFQTE